MWIKEKDLRSELSYRLKEWDEDIYEKFGIIPKTYKNTYIIQEYYLPLDYHLNAYYIDILLASRPSEFPNENGRIDIIELKVSDFTIDNYKQVINYKEAFKAKLEERGMDSVYDIHTHLVLNSEVNCDNRDFNAFINDYSGQVNVIEYWPSIVKETTFNKL